MIKTLVKLFRRSEDIRGTVTAAQAMAYVESCSDSYDNFKSIDAVKHDDGELIVWNVSARLTTESGVSKVIEFHVWCPGVGEHGCNEAGIYGEW
tara:strand:- start:408 stop:689 length:282 start_codon:yes stop_codon:yes gene_type:complete